MIKYNKSKKSFAFAQRVRNVLDEWFHVSRNVSLLHSLSAELHIKQFLEQDHSFQSLQVNPPFAGNRLIPFNDPLLELFPVCLRHWGPTDRHACLFQHVGSENGLRDVPEVKSSLNLVSIKDVHDSFLPVIEKVAAVQISVDHSKMLDISHLFFVIFVKFNIGKDSMMDLVPSLNLLRDFCMLLFEDSW